MKKTLLALALLTPFSAYSAAPTQEQFLRFCNSLANLAQATAEARDRGIAQTAAKEAVNSSLTEDQAEFKQFLLNTVENIYTHKEINPFQAKIVVKLTCVQTFILHEK